MQSQNISSRSRRQFLKQGTLAGLGVAVGLGTAGMTQAQGESKPKVIDIHTHISSKAVGRGLSVAQLLKWMDSKGVDKVAVLPLVSPEGWSFPISTQWVMEQVRDHRDRLIPFCDIDPRTSLSDNQVRGLLKQYVKLGARGFGEHKCGLAIDDPRNIRLFKIAGECGLPVLLHIDTTCNHDKPGLPGLEKVLQTASKTTFIGHAQGWWASISGDVKANEMAIYPQGPVASGGAIDRLMDKYPNLYGDISAGSGANAFRRDMKFGREFMIRRADRLLFGTDYMMDGQGVGQFNLLRDMKLPSDVEAKIRRANVEKLLNV